MDPSGGGALSKAAGEMMKEMQEAQEQAQKLQDQQKPAIASRILLSDSERLPSYAFPQGKDGFRVYLLFSQYPFYSFINPIPNIQ